MRNPVKSSVSEAESNSLPSSSPASESSAASLGWVKVGAIAAASAALGGLAAAWFYRKTLSQLREAAHEFPDSPNDSTKNEMEEDF